ncbi:MAG: hydrogenase maturation nickel metallochaperone HypA [Caldilineaceae bacterium]
MHEFALTEQLLAAVLETAATAPGTGPEPAAPLRIIEIHLCLGSLTGIVPDAMRFCFAPLAEGTAAAHAQLVFREDVAVATCRVCGDGGPVSLPLPSCCAHCGGRLDVTGGTALMLERVVLAEVDTV